MTVKPVGKVNQLRQVILGSLVSDHLEREPRLARNVSWSNVDRAAKRWVP